MAQLPEHFEYWQSSYGGFPEGQELYHFQFNSNNETFDIGTVNIQAHEFDPYTYNTFALGIRGGGIDFNDITNHNLLLPGSHFGAIATPRFYEWTAKNKKRLPEVTAVMQNVFKTLIVNPEDIPQEEDSGFMGFHTHLRDDGGLRLQVFGNCACLEPDLYSGLVRGVEHGFAEYGLHNADSQIQRISLYAGLGHIARLASEGSD